MRRAQHRPNEAARAASRLHRTHGLLSRIKYTNRGKWCGPRVVPVLREGVVRKMPKTLLQTLNLTLTPTPTYVNSCLEKMDLFLLVEKIVDYTKTHNITEYFPD